MAERGRPLFSIGAVARMLDLSAATIRNWESRYGLVVPERSEGGQRLYSPGQVDELRFLREQIAAGRRPREAHRLLAERLARGGPIGGARASVLLSKGRRDVSELLRQLLGGEAAGALRAAGKGSAAAVVVIDADAGAAELLTERLRALGATVHPVDL